MENFGYLEIAIAREAETERSSTDLSADCSSQKASATESPASPRSPKRSRVQPTLPEIDESDQAFSWWGMF